MTEVVAVAEVVGVIVAEAVSVIVAVVVALLPQVLLVSGTEASAHSEQEMTCFHQYLSIFSSPFSLDFLSPCQHEFALCD